MRAPTDAPPVRLLEPEYCGCTGKRTITSTPAGGRCGECQLPLRPRNAAQRMFEAHDRYQLLADPLRAALPDFPPDLSRAAGDRLVMGRPAPDTDTDTDAPPYVPLEDVCDPGLPPPGILVLAGTTADPAGLREHLDALLAGPAVTLTVTTIPAFARRACCWRCDPEHGGMIVCPDCGNKRCPRASDHDLPCTDSNEPGQPGSIYGGYPAPDRTVPPPPGHALPEHVAALPLCKATGKVSWPTVNAAWGEIKRLGWKTMQAFPCRDCDGAHMGTPKGQHRRRGGGRRRRR